MIVAAFKSLTDLPDAAANRYDDSVTSLRTTLIAVAGTGTETPAAALEYADSSRRTEEGQRMLAKIQCPAGACAQ